jgi:hypothetical protein
LPLLLSLLHNFLQHRNWTNSWLARKLGVQREDLDREMKESRQKIMLKYEWRENDWRMKPNWMKTGNDWLTPDMRCRDSSVTQVA